MEKENKYRRLGIYGGTFSPPHLGHVHAAEVFLSMGGIDELMVIPTYETPLKARTEMTAPEDRLAMCRLAFSFSPAVSVSDMEILRTGKSYTSETLTQLSDPHTRLSFLCGTDMLLTMGRWHDPKTIFSLAEIVCMRREDEADKWEALSSKAAEYTRDFGAHIRFLEAPPIEISSTDIRARIARGEDAGAYLSDTVYAYIKEKGLYV